ncbi:MAG: TonB-dependent receptor, partial [Candidatus Eremiobacteraeota bacterium]|nr:TonB-dependent receptor [Candidatus Eremiobacteraeota bacterium]
MRTFVLVAAIAAGYVGVCAPARAHAAYDVAAGRVTGTVSSSDGVPVSGASVVLSGHGPERTTTTDASGRFVLTDVATGTYALAVNARGYNHLGERAIDVRASESPLLSLVLERASATLVTIGRVRTPDAQPLSTSAVPSVVLDAQRYGAQGYANVADIIGQNSISTTVIRPNGAGAGAPAVVALRGPDPTETLVQIDGHSVTSGHTGSFDLSLLDPADISSVQLVYGIAPTSLVGPNTIDGAVNVRTLGPTTHPHGLLRVSGGSFGAFGETLQATGTADRLGYAFSLHRATSQGEVRDANLTAADGAAVTVSGALAGTTALGKLHYDFDRGAGFVELAFHDASTSRDLSAALTSLSPDGYVPSLGSSLSSHDAAYTLDLRAPLGRPRADGVSQTAVLYSHGSSLANQSVLGPAAGSSPYLFSDVDRLGDDAVQLDTIVGKGTLSAKFELRTEALLTPQVAFANVVDQSIRRQLLGVGDSASPAQSDGLTSTLLTQTQRTFVVRYAGEPSAQLHYAFAAYYSDFTSFGTSIDPRASIVWTPTARSAVRASIGTTFQAPQVTELYVPPVLPPANADGYISVG